MARPREFDRDTALDRAMSVFWANGFAATSTDDLLRAMKIGRQSMYDSFGDKRRLYLEALSRYQDANVAIHLERLNSKVSPLAGITAMMLGHVTDDKSVRERGCMGIGAIAEFGIGDRDVVKLRAISSARMHRALVDRLRAAQAAAEIGKSLDVETAALFLATTAQGLKIAARAGTSPKSLRATALFALASLKNT
jgi:TetR/AcrR family transcriptional repressor of nem operon